MIEIVRLDRHCGLTKTAMLDVIAPWSALASSSPCSCRVHWAGGHHLDVRVRADLSDAAEAVREIAARLTGWVAGHPSTSRADPEDYATLSRRLAKAEDIPPNEIPALGVNNAVTLRRETGGSYLGSAALAGVRTSFEEAALPSLLDLLGCAQPGRAPLRMQLALVQVANAYLEGGARNGYRSVRAHSASFLAGRPDFESRFSAAYESSRDQLLPRVEAILLGDEAAAGCRDELSAAITAAGETLDRLWLHEAGDVIGAGVHGFSRGGAEPVLPPAIAKWLPSKVAFGSDHTRRALGRHRTLINIVYAQFPTLGMSAITRFACAYAAFRGLADVLGLSHDIQPLAGAAS